MNFICQENHVCIAKKCQLRISQAQKANELIKKDQWLLNGDGTTLMQQKVAILINGIMFGVHDVPDGTYITDYTRSA